jgi:hypothetical protein
MAGPQHQLDQAEAAVTLKNLTIPVLAISYGAV